MAQIIKRILAMALTAVLLLSALPAGMEGPVEAKAAEDGIVLFDDAFSDSIKSADMSNVTVLDNIPGPDGNPTSVISLAGGWSLSRFGTGSTALDITPAVEKSGNLVLDIYASYATADAEIRVYTAAWQGAKVSFFRALNQGWNTITIPVSEIGSNDFYGIGIVSHTGTCYVDNVSFAWQGRSIQIDVQPVDAELQFGETEMLSISASLSDGSDASGLRYHWYFCDDLNRTNPISLDVPRVPTCQILPPRVGIHYFYCEITGEGLQSVYSDVITVTVRFPDDKQNIVIFDDAFSDSVKPADQSGLSVLENIPGADGSESNVISLSGGWSLSRFGTGQTPLDITDAVAEEGVLIFDIYASYATTDTEIRVYTAAWQGAQTSFTYALAAGWNTVKIPAAQIGSADFYGIGIVSHTGTCYLDNVRFEWVASAGQRIRIDTQPKSVRVLVNKGAKLAVSASIPGGIDASAIQYQWYQCADAEKTDPVAIADETGDYFYTVPTEASVCYYYCTVSAEGLTSVDSEVAAITTLAQLEYGSIILFDDAYSEHIDPNDTSGVTLKENIAGADGFLTNLLFVSGGRISYFCTGQTPIDTTEARYNYANIVFDMYVDGDTTKTKIEIYTGADQSPASVYTMALKKGWNVVSIPVSDIYFYGIGMRTYAIMCYVDNVRIEWGTPPEKETVVVDSGVCGDNATWQITSDNVFTVSGTGAMTDYAERTAPWFDHKSAIRTVIIQDGITSIGAYSFMDCIEMTSVDIPDSVTDIGEYSFYNCKKLPEISIPDGVTIIEDYTFYACVSVTELTIPAHVTSIGNSAFYAWDNLTYLTVPAGVTEIGNDAFTYCTRLKSLTFGSAVPPVLEVADDSGATDIFRNITATIRYPDTEAWTEAFRQSCGGNVTWEPYQAILSASVTLDSVLGVSFKATNGGTVAVTVGGEEYPVTEGDGVYTVSVFAQDMTKDIEATLTDPAGNVLDTQTFRLSDYVADIGNGNNSAEMKALAAATLNYCQYAAKLKGNYDGEMPQLDTIPENAFDGCKITASGTLTDVRVFAYLEDACQIGLRLPVAEGYGVTVNGKTVDVSGGVCYMPRILPQEYDSDYTFAVTKDGAEYCQVSISVLTYLSGAFQNNICGDNADMENLLIAMYHYYAAAEAVASGTAA